jgi:hypothetical protein
MVWRLLKGSEATIAQQLNDLGVQADDIFSFGMAIDAGKFAALVWIEAPEIEEVVPDPAIEAAKKIAEEKAAAKAKLEAELAALEEE